MPYADLSRDRIDCLFAWNEKDRLLMLAGARYRRDDHGRDIVSLPLSWGSCLSLRGMFGAELKLSPSLGAWAADHKAKVVTPALALRTLTDPGTVDPSGDSDLDDIFSMIDSGLRPFQAVGVEWMMTAGSGILGDEMGSGKTVQSLTFIERRTDTLPALVIVPNSVKGHWARLAGRWAPTAVPYVVDGTAAQRRKTLKAASTDPNALVIINIESVRSFSRLAPYGSIRLRRCQECDRKSGDSIKVSQCETHEKELNGIAFRSVFLDEAHRIGNPESKQTRAIWQVMDGPFVKYRWGLSGTVLADHFGNLWSVLHGILPDDFPVKSKAIDRYCLTRDMPIGPPEIIGLNPATRDELFGILDPHFRRMLKSVTSPQLPPVVRETREVELSPKAMKLYRDVESGLFGDLGDGNLIITHSNLTKADRCQQIAAATVEIDKSADPDDISKWTIRMKDPSPKVDAVMEILEDGGYLDGTGPGAAIACVHKELVRLITNRLNDRKVRFGLVTGDQSTAERDVAVARFQNGDDRVLIFTVKAGSVGLDMTAADLLINVQRPWSMIEAVQTEGRVHRIGSEIHQSVRIIDILTVGTIEERQVTVLGQKLARLEEINRDTAAVPQNEQDPDLVLEAEFLLNADLFAGAGLAPTRMSGETSAEYASVLADHFARPAADEEIDPETLLTRPDAEPVFTADMVRETMDGLRENYRNRAAVPSEPFKVPALVAPEQPERMDCPCCGKDTKVNNDGAIRYHFAADPECYRSADSRMCKAVGEQWTWTPGAAPVPETTPETATDAPLPAEQPVAGYVCRIPAGPTGCGQPVQLTANKRARSHLNPQGERCGGGSDWPLAVDAKGNRTDTKPEEGMCTRCGEPRDGHGHEDTPLGVRAVAEPDDLPTAYARPGEPGFPEPENGLLVHSTPSATVGLVVEDGVVVDGPPYAQRWAVGETKEAIESGTGETTWLPDQTPAAPHRVLITGSQLWGMERDPETKQLTAQALHERSLLEEKIRSCFETDPEAVMVSGACSTGADEQCEALWTSLGGQVERHPADWGSHHGNAAGMKRNHRMVALGADLCLGFIKDGSPGATACVDEAARNGIPCIVTCEDGKVYVFNDPAEAPEPSPAAVALAEDMRTPEQEEADRREVEAAVGATHLFDDGAGGLWQHPGPKATCPMPDCHVAAEPARPAGLDFEGAGLPSPYAAIGPAADALTAEGPLPDQVVSATKINDWQQCKRKWWLRWYRQLTTDEDFTDVRNTGIRVHEALAAWYVPEGMERRDPRDVLKAAIRRDWNRTLQQKQAVTGTELYDALVKKWESVAVLERAMVEGYMDWLEESGADSEFTVVGSELEIAVNLTDPGSGMTVQARGVVDAKIQRKVDGARKFIDHKTVGDFDRATKFLKMRNQMLHYGLIEWLSTGEGEARCDGALYNMLRRVKRTAKAKPPFYQRKTINHNELQLRAYRARLLGEARSMARAEKLLEAGVPHHIAVPPSPSDDCTWKCEFAAVCPMFDDGSRAEDMLAVVYRQGDPWSRYDLLGGTPTPDQSI